jgi:hypothetical protein
MRRIVVCVVVGIVVLMAPVVWAQEEKKEEGHVFVVSSSKAQFQNIDKVLESWEKTIKPIGAKNEHVLSFRIFIHMWGSDWTILTIHELRKEMIPDKEWRRRSPRSRRCSWPTPTASSRMSRA